MIFEILGLYFLKEPLKKNKFAQTKIISGDKQKANPNLIREPFVVRVKMIINISDKSCPKTSIKEALAGSWFAITRVEIILNTKSMQKYFLVNHK